MERQREPVRPMDPNALRRVVDQVVSWREWRERLASGRQLRIKHGVDATAPELHLGHAVNYWVMRRLQEHGHRVIFLIGDVTTGIGDPSGRARGRPQLERATIERNAETFLEQASRIMHTSSAVFEVRHNSEWFDELQLREFLKLLSGFTHQQLLGRDAFQKRLSGGDELRMHEVVYPVLQGYDSYALEADVTVCGTDQLFNEVAGRTIQKQLGQAPQVVVTTRITPGIDGREKQSKTLGNYIAIEDPPREKFGKLMSIPDGLIVDYLEVYTEVDSKEIAGLASQMRRGELNPRDAKRQLARAVVERYHGRETAEAEDRWFMARFSRGRPPPAPTEVIVSEGASVLEIVRACLPDVSISHSRRLIAQGAVKTLHGRLTDPMETGAIDDHQVIQLGKRRWYRVRYDGPSACRCVESHT